MKFPNKEDNSSQIGAALITSILALLLATLLGFALITVGMGAMEITNNGIQQTEAFYIADSGLTHATGLINKVKKQDYSTILTTGDAAADTGDELSAPPEAGLWAATDSIPAGNGTAGGVTFGTGRYFVNVRNDTAPGETATTDANGLLIVTSTGIGRDGSTATVEAVVESVALDVPGLLSNGDARFNSELTVLGIHGTIQINGTPTFSGGAKSACAEQGFEIMTPSIPLGDAKVGPLCDIVPTTGTTALFDQPRALPPIIDIARLRTEFRPLADYVFKNDGEIYPQTNGVQRVLPLSAFEKTALGLHEWKYKAGGVEWGHSIDTRLPDGNYYFEDTNLKMSKGGDPINPPKVSLFVEGSISLNNEIAFQPNMPGYAMITTNDLTMSSKYSTATNPGLVYAYGQIQFSNATTIVGGLVAANYYKEDGTFGPDVNDPGGANPVDGTKGAIQVTGDTTIISSDFGNVAGAATVSWREVRF